MLRHSESKRREKVARERKIEADKKYSEKTLQLISRFDNIGIKSIELRSSQSKKG